MLRDNFLLPDGANREHLRTIGYQLVDVLVDQVLGGRSLGCVPSSYPIHIPEQGRTWQSIMAEIEGELLPRCVNLHQPRYMAHMDSVPLFTTVLADALISALNNNQLSYELSPLFTQMEIDLLGWFARQFGLGAGAGGLLMAGGSLANILALHLARQACGGEVVIVPESAHTSFDKAMAVLGFSPDQLVKVPCNPQGEMLIPVLADLLAQSRKPFCLVAIAGTTVTGAYDNLVAVAELAQQYDCWLHVDAAYGGAVMFAPRWQKLLKGIELAHSITFNPQKWLWVARTCAMLLVHDRTLLGRGLGTPLPYMDETQINLGSYGLQGTRRSDVLKLWIGLQSLGTAGYGQMIEHSIAQGHQFAQWVDQHPLLQLAHFPTVNIVCMRSRNPDIDVHQLHRHLRQSAQLWLSLPLWQGERLLRAVLLHPYSQWS